MRVAGQKDSSSKKSGILNSSALVCGHRKKFIGRYVSNLVNKQVLCSRPFREGKNFSTKFFLSPEHLRKLKLTKPKTSSGDRNISVINRVIFDQNNPNQAHLAPITLESCIDKIYHNFETETRDHSEPLNMVIFTRLITALSAHNTSEVTRLLKSNNLSQIIAYIENSTFNYSELISLDINKRNFLTEKLVDFMLMKKEVLFNLASKETLKKKLFTNFRFHRIVFILNELFVNKVFLMNDLLSKIRNELEANKEYKIDKRTLFRMLNDLEEITMLKLVRFRVDFENESVEADDQLYSMNKVFALDIESGVSENQLRNGSYFHQKINCSLKRNPVLSKSDFEPNNDILFQVDDVGQHSHKFKQFKQFIHLEIVFRKFAVSKSFSGLLKRLSQIQVNRFLKNEVFEIPKIEKINLCAIDLLMSDLMILSKNYQFINFIEAKTFLLDELELNLMEINSFSTSLLFFRNCSRENITVYLTRVFKILQNGLKWELNELNKKCPVIYLLGMILLHLFENKRLDLHLENSCLIVSLK